MAAGCCNHEHHNPHNTPAWRRALWIALAVNGIMFAIEMVAGAAAGSRALQADALDFFGDAASYGISLAVAGLAVVWRSRAAAAKGGTLVLFALYVLASAAYAAFTGANPKPDVMGAIGIAALVANLGVAVMLYRFRNGDANMRSVWICSRNDAIGNIAVVAAAAGVFGTGTAWPDLAVAAILAGLGIWGGVSILTQAFVEMLEADIEPQRTTTDLP